MSLFFAEHERPLIEREIDFRCRAAIVIPVRNESENIVSTLDSFAGQVDFSGRLLDSHSFEIIILANNCTDDSVAQIETWRKTNARLTVHLAELNLPAKNANIGYVRRRLMNEAYARLSRNNLKSGVIMTTDGDTCVAPNWIAANLRELANGADAVGGRILIKSEDLHRMNIKARRFHLLDAGYRLAAAEIEARLDIVEHDPVSRHHQHFNGSFAVTIDAYRRAGGVPAVRFLEDVAFYQALQRIDARVRHSPFVRVQTSSRIAGRTELGLSTQINEWTVMGENGASYFVESAKAIAERATRRKSLREIWRNQRFDRREISELAERLMISGKILEKELPEKQAFGTLLEKIYDAQFEEGNWARKYPLVCVTGALPDLRQLLVPLRKRHHSALALSHTSSR